MPASRRAAAAGCLALAAALNVAALGAAGELAGSRLPQATHAAVPLQTRAVLLSARPAVADALPSPAAAAPPDEPATHAARAAPAVGGAQAEADAATAATRAAAPTLARPALETDTPPEPPIPERPLRLYAFDEVDVAAEPVTEWALDPAALDDAGVSRLVFELVVDERGEVLGCTVLDPIGLDPAARTALERRLAATPLRPAERAGRRVASVRRIVMEIAEAG